MDGQRDLSVTWIPSCAHPCLASIMPIRTDAAVFQHNLPLVVRHTRLKRETRRHKPREVSKKRVLKVAPSD